MFKTKKYQKCISHVINHNFSGIAAVCGAIIVKATFSGLGGAANVKKVPVCPLFYRIGIGTKANINKHQNLC